MQSEPERLGNEVKTYPVAAARQSAAFNATRAFLFWLLAAVWLFALAATLARAGEVISEPVISKSVSGESVTGSPLITSPLITLPSWISSVLALLGTIKIVLSFFEVRFTHWISDKLNEIAASEEMDDDDYLRGVFTTPQWKTYCFIGRLLSLRLPTLADLERAVKLQREAAIDAGGNLRKSINP